MDVDHLPHLVCPACRGALELLAVATNAGRVIEGQLTCPECRRPYPIVGGIPRFVDASNYAASFGYQWLRHARTQYDSESGKAITERRFFSATGWPRRMEGQQILEVGSGSGRFTEQAAQTGAFVASVDYSRAVEANHASNGHLANVLIVQADIFALPFATGSFDKVFCFGVLQHTPDPERAFLALPAMLTVNGQLAIDVYYKSLATTILNLKYLVRWLVRGARADRLYAGVERWISWTWPLARIVARIPKLGPALLHRLIIPYYSLGLSDDQARIWATLDAFDMLSPRYDSPQRVADVQRWFERAGLRQVRVGRGSNGIVAAGQR